MALSEETVYCLQRNTIQKTNYKSISDNCLKESQITNKTIRILENFSERFEQLSELGSGQFGKVLKVKDKIYDSICALKIISQKSNFNINSKFIF